MVLMLITAILNAILAFTYLRLSRRDSDKMWYFLSVLFAILAVLNLITALT